ncbi:LacI family DNA-binding transcriptional regulator [Dactylosporangium aurantiacum]|uniref:LacI family DNA-binding transcriptional regulator n=1 Tax=Dactylosporangium aurantiacum TaxID=35754 RepID=A0A9Q9MGA4_9ACTN|nr:LacI family DNA-binding transcriptional regulator [Dactylosporangium aurantiacum]MDG6109913.1 LacI family DNA-binding transcriptional regulator [Dactylosporangium aurantiacum]UWZ58088.1 LacI family DNA-binding transcriptional regulator [Dactylosporangium aurantiacum]
MDRRPTMADIASRAGVSRMAVSYALNGRAGVSEELRERIVRIAAELGFSASAPARELRGAVVQAAGLTMRRPSSTAFNVEVFRRELISGVQSVLMARGFGLALQSVADVEDELTVYRRWSSERRVAGILVCDLEVDDPRPAQLETLDLPAVVIGGPLPRTPPASVWSDDGRAVTEAVAYLAALGHRRIVHVSGPARLLHTRVRTEAYEAACATAGIEPVVIAADYTGEGGAQATRRVLSTVRPPTAIVYDNDVMAVAGLGVAMEMGVAVPDELSIVAGDDSALCQVVRPALTVLKRDIVGYGAHAAELLFTVIDGGSPGAVLDHAAELVVRSSTAPAHRRP